MGPRRHRSDRQRLAFSPTRETETILTGSLDQVAHLARLHREACPGLSYAVTDSLGLTGRSALG